MPHLTLFGGFFALFSKNLPETINFSDSQSPFFIDEQGRGCRPGSFMRSPIGVDAGSEFGPTPFL
jgi:hypothetical protein